MEESPMLRPLLWFVAVGSTFLDLYVLERFGSAFARKVGSARSKYKIEPPAIDGDENFQRIYRAHQNSVEFYPLFLGSLWTSSIMLHQVPASIFGLVYMYGRKKFFSGYVESADKRIPGFKICIVGLQGLLICSVVGLANHGFMAYFGKSIWASLKSIAN